MLNLTLVPVFFLSLKEATPLNIGLLNRFLTYLTLTFFCFSINGFGQRFHISNKKKFEKIKFELVNNLMVVPVELNGAKLSFILDTGVSSPILFNLNNQDSIQINKVSEITLRGLGDGEPIEHQVHPIGLKTNVQ